MIKPYPAAVFGTCALITFISKKYLEGISIFPVEIAILLALVMLLISCWVLIQSILQFRKMKTTIHPFGKPRTLITDGAFSYSRNPIYLGLLLLLLAQALYSNTVFALSGSIAFFLIINMMIIPQEEKLLQKIFDKKYMSYVSAVPRWFLII